MAATKLWEVYDIETPFEIKLHHSMMIVMTFMLHIHVIHVFHWLVLWMMVMMFHTITMDRCEWFLKYKSQKK